MSDTPTPGPFPNGHDDSMAKLYAACAAARGEWPAIARNRTATVTMKSGGKYSFTYADLFDVLSAIDPVLSAHGLTVFQEAQQDPGGWHVVTTIAHADGGTKTTTYPVKAQPQRSLDDCQSFQSAFQMAKRYALGAALGIATEESIEGDPRAHRVQSAPTTADPFRTDDGLRAPVGAKIHKDMTPRQMAEEAARAIEALLDDPKTPTGLNGVWNRNERFIERLKEKHSDLFDNIYDKFQARFSAMKEADDIAGHMTA